MAESEKNGSSRTVVTHGGEPPVEFLGTLAHELRNPLAPIRNGTELLRSICSDPRQLQVVEMISRQVVHLTRLLDDLLDVTRMRRGLLTLKKQTVDVAVIVEGALETLRPAMDSRRQNLLVSLPPFAVQMHCDPVRLVQVLQNLLDNAHRFTSEGGSICLKAQVTDRLLVFEVTDDGVGIDSAMLPRLFNMFAQGDQQLHRPDGGLGLGLVIARNLVEMHGGTITAESPGAGQGSRFTIRLPIEIGNAPVTRSGECRSVAGLRVLIIDDNEIAARTLAECLVERSWQVMTAGTGEEGLEIAGRFRPQAVIVDIALPGINGFEVARRLRNDASLQKPVLIAVSGYSLDMLREKDASLFARYVLKPAAPGDLAAMIERAMREPNARAETDPQDSDPR